MVACLHQVHARLTAVSAAAASSTPSQAPPSSAASSAAAPMKKLLAAPKLAPIVAEAFARLEAEV
jgi:hypothetical protein